jgi:hypothetical protein
VIAHGGGIFGFLSEERYYPDEDLSVVVLINTAGPADPGGIADGIETVVLGKAPEEPRRTFAGDLSQFAGAYQGPGRGQTLDVTVAVDSAGLTLKMPQGPVQHLRYVDGLTFGAGAALYHFVRHGGAIVELRADQVGGYYILNRRSEDASPRPRPPADGRPRSSTHHLGSGVPASNHAPTAPNATMPTTPVMPPTSGDVAITSIGSTPSPCALMLA